ncbi:MAG: FG-GAP-like repeat-containing protein [Acidobacteriota bacterium]|nr:FG-GAP-like repeat-containing protein [Acidobacteriota bacterium]
MQTKHKLNHSLFIFGLMILFFSAAFPLVQAQTAAPGDLDTTFGNGGKVVTAITQNEDIPTRVRIQPDGKIVTVGVAVEGGWGCPVNSFLVRHNADGTIDNSFGTNGAVVISFGSEEINFQDFVILPDGKLLVTGYKSIDCGNSTDLVIYRYTANGALDATFGTNGVITTPWGNGTWQQRLVLQPDGKFVVASNGGVVRYNPNGTQDTTFGTSGTPTLNGSRIGEILVQTDGKLLIAGDNSVFGNGNIFVRRYNPNGTLDNSFGANGIVLTDIDNLPNRVGGMALQPDGKIIVNNANFSSTFPFSFWSLLSSSIVRYNPNGTLDNTFGTNGIVRITEPPNQYDRSITLALAIQQNGKILTAGGRNNTFAISRYNSNGTIDASFGTNGVVITPIGNYSGAIVSIALQTDGKIVAVGGANGSVGLVRYHGDAVTTAPRTRFDFDGDGKADVSVFRPSNGTWYLQQSQAGFTGIQFGQAGDKITPADYDGDGKTDVAVYRAGIWYLQRSSQGFTGIAFGAATDIPAPADFDGDGRSELAVFRPSNGVWYLYNLTNNQNSAVAFGTSGDIPVAADYDGDGRADVAVFRPSNGTWYLQRSQAGFTGIRFGDANDKTVPADYDGDGKADVAVFRPSNGVWYLLGSTMGFAGTQFGQAGDQPAAADYDGDGKADIAVFRDGIWYLRQSTAGFAGIQFGLATDKPVPNAFVP